MGAAPMAGMDHSKMGTAPMARMDHSKMGTAPMAGMDHSKMGTAPMAGMDHSKMDTAPMAGMDHSKMGTAPMAGMDHSKMGHAMPPPASAAAATPERAVGWADAGTRPGEKALSYADLRSARRNSDARPPTQEIEVRLTGIMERYMWTINGRPFGHEDVIRVNYGDRVRIKYVNTTMMAHPMHLHGMFVELENGQTDRMPRKHVTVVPPGKELSVILTADEPGEWPFHCHLLFHMEAGMMTRFVVGPKDERKAAVK